MTARDAADLVMEAALTGSVVPLKGMLTLLLDVLGEQANRSDRWCGTGLEYCSAPDCQINYAAACDAVNITTNRFRELN